MRVLARIHGVCVQNARQLDFQLDRAIQVEDPVYAVFVVGGCEDVRYNEFAGAGHRYGVVAEVGLAIG